MPSQIFPFASVPHLSRNAHPHLSPSPLSLTSLSRLSLPQVAFNTIASSPRTPTTQQMAAARMAELSQSYITQIQADWFNCVVQYNYRNRTRNPGVCG